MKTHWPRRMFFGVLVAGAIGGLVLCGAITLEVMPGMTVDRSHPNEIKVELAPLPWMLPLELAALGTGALIGLGCRRQKPRCA